MAAFCPQPSRGSGSHRDPRTPTRWVCAPLLPEAKLLFNSQKPRGKSAIICGERQLLTTLTHLVMKKLNSLYINQTVPSSVRLVSI